jgi:hypothetical protein
MSKMTVEKSSCQNEFNHKEHDYTLSTPLASYNPIHYFVQSKSSPYVFNRFSATENRQDRQKYFNQYNAYLFLKNDIHPYESTQPKQTFDQNFIYFNEKEIPSDFATKFTDHSKIRYIDNHNSATIENIQEYRECNCMCQVHGYDQNQGEKYVMKIQPISDMNYRCKREQRQVCFNQQESRQISFPKCEICRKKWEKEIQGHYALVY